MEKIDATTNILRREQPLIVNKPKYAKNEQHIEDWNFVCSKTSVDKESRKKFMNSFSSRISVVKGIEKTPQHVDEIQFLEPIL